VIEEGGALRQDPGCDPVEQRLEQVVIGRADDRHVDLRAAQEASGEQAAEAGPDDDDSRALWRVWRR
jgi:hypothetical protein